MAITGTPVTPTSSGQYGLTLSELESAVATSMGWSVSDSTELTKIDQALTSAGRAACLWEGRQWWFLFAVGTFSTSDGTASYDLRSEIDDSVLAPVRVYRDTTLLQPISYTTYLNRVRVLASGTTGVPTSYALAGQLSMYLYPTPSSTETITVDYLLRHSALTNAGSTDADLRIPGEFHWPIYVNGAVWLLKHETMNPSALVQCPAFVQAIQDMQASAPDSYDPMNASTRLGDEVYLPDGKQVIIIEDS